MPRDGPAKLRDGFNLLASDLDRAIQIGRFEHAEVYLLGQAREAAWVPGLFEGDRQPRPFRLNLAALSRVAFDRMTLVRARKRLIACQVFQPDEEECGWHWINKDYAQWLDKHGQSRFTVEQIAWIVAAGPMDGPRGGQPKNNDSPQNQPGRRRRRRGMWSKWEAPDE